VNLGRRPIRAVVRTTVVAAIACSGAACATTGAGSSSTASEPLVHLETFSSDPCPSTDAEQLGYMCLEFDGATYRGTAANPSPIADQGAQSLTIPTASLTRFGVATSVNADIGTGDLTVYRIEGVDPAAAVVLLLAGDPNQMVVWTRGGESPALIPGLCQYYLDPAWRACLATPTSRSRTRSPATAM
jgi:hypothetical protein